MLGYWGRKATSSFCSFCKLSCWLASVFFPEAISCLLFVQLHVEYNCILFFGQLLLTTAFSQVLFRLAAYLFTLEFLCDWSSPPSVPTLAGLALPLPEHRTAALTVLFLGGVHLAMAGVYLGNTAALLEVSPILVCPWDVSLKHRHFLLYITAAFN